MLKLPRVFDLIMNGESGWYNIFQIWKCSDTSVLAGLQIMTAATSLHAFETSFFHHSFLTCRVVMIMISVMMSCDMIAPLIFFILVVLSVVLHAQNDGLKKRLYWARAWFIVGLFPVIWSAFV
jgi:hypothetical protein